MKHHKVWAGIGAGVCIVCILFMGLFFRAQHQLNSIADDTKSSMVSMITQMANTGNRLISVGQEKNQESYDSILMEMKQYMGAYFLCADYVSAYTDLLDYNLHEERFSFWKGTVSTVVYNLPNDVTECDIDTNEDWLAFIELISVFTTYTNRNPYMNLDEIFTHVDKDIEQYDYVFEK